MQIEITKQDIIDAIKDDLIYELRKDFYEWIFEDSSDVCRIFSQKLVDKILPEIKNKVDNELMSAVKSDLVQELTDRYEEDIIDEVSSRMSSELIKKLKLRVEQCN